MACVAYFGSARSFVRFGHGGPATPRESCTVIDGVLEIGLYRNSKVLLTPNF